MIIISNIFIMLVYFLTSVAGLVFLKMSDGKLLSLHGGVGLFLYATGFVIWYLILTRMALSTAFPIAAGGLVVVTQIAGYFILKESISLSHLLGVLLIISGIYFVATGDVNL